MVVTTRVERPWEGVSGKVTAHHRDRLAVVYVRQSTLRQLRHNTESAKLQYALVERAVMLGWPPSRTLVIDEDMGHSASGAQDRPGFTRLVSEVGLGHVGVVLGIEMSRLARSGRDWHQLLELCALSCTLLADPDGVYDPAEHNDRLLLGLKGTISEAELYLIKQRMWGGRIAKARRGELGFEPPIGYWRRPSGEIVIDPDEQVQSVIRLVFAKFEELGTLHALLAWLVANGIELGGRQRCGPERGEVVWRRPNRTIVRNTIRSPVYAGIYAYGRKHTEYHGAGRRERAVKDPADWLAYLPGRLPAYISVEQWQRNLARLETNRNTATTPGSPRGGNALLAGLLRCGKCGKRRMGVYYRSHQGQHGHLYHCSWEYAHYGGPRCQELAGACLDEHITTQVLTAIAPATLVLSLHAAEQVERDRAAVEKIWSQRLERADYLVDRARRAHHLAEPENRLVVRQLEAEWEQALADREKLREDHARFAATTPRTLSRAEREAIRELAADLPSLWHAPTTTIEDRKHLLRLLIEQVAVRVIGESEQVEATVTWAGGHRTTSRLVRPVAKFEQLSYYPQLLSRTRELAEQGVGTRQTAQILNAEGFRPPKRSESFTMDNVRDLLRRQGLLKAQGRSTRAPYEKLLGPDDRWATDLAAELGIPPSTMNSWIIKGWVAARKIDARGGMWIVHADQAEQQRLRELHARPNGYYTRLRFLDHQQAPPPNADTGERDDGPRRGT
ncbi:recombinase family protein [Streptomyces sp. NPDC004393]|uniref:recombinase family protein n=1 Tax=Streptomyces sp. NPDC004533 TaxID=3154278 RepID=UPI0033BA8CE3